MKIGLLTYHFSDNYGALFQAYSLKRWFEKRGVKAEFLNYHPRYVEEGGSFDRPWKPSLWRKNATILYMRLSCLFRRMFASHEQVNEFERFRNEYLGVSGPRIECATELSGQIREYDLLVCGSDQIWNPSIQRGLDPVYFLDIPGSERIRKISYAPSFGRTQIEKSYYPELRELIKSLDGVTVRETTALKILRDSNIGVENVKVVPDPTILLGDIEIAGSASSGVLENVFCYALRTDEDIREISECVAAHFGLPLVSARSSRQRWRDIGQGVSAGPVDWIRSLTNSRFVVSNSFHGVALSIVHNQRFIAVKLPGKRSAMNARVESLLNQIGLADRLVEGFDPEAIQSLVRTEIDWSSVNRRIAKLRQDGESYLISQLAASAEAKR